MQKLKNNEVNYVLNPIISKLEEWIEYDKNKPKCKYEGNEELHDNFRLLNDRDCVIMNGNIMADTIFSLWNPMLMVLKNINPGIKFAKVKKYKKEEDKKHDDTKYLEEILENIEKYLPPDNELVKELCKFTEKSLLRVNVMLLPNREMQSRGAYFLDQMPRTLYECFEGGIFFEFFNKDEKQLIDWIIQEKLEMFFDGDIKRENIKPLIKSMSASESKRLKNEEDIMEMLKTYNEILDKRIAFYS